jgi:hypothetical protein
LQFVDLVFEEAKSLPLNEGAQKVDFVGATHLGTQLRSERRFAAGICHQRGIGERRRRPR